MNHGSHAHVVPRSAATVVLLRPGPGGVAEVLLTRRPSTMAFGADLHVFPGGAVDAEDREHAGTDDPWAVARQAAAREALEEAGVELDPSGFVALSHWSTPPILPRRFSTRFFVAELPPGAEPRFDTDEVVDHVWLTPEAALDAMADGVLQLWIPTSSTLQQLDGVASLAEVRSRYGEPPVEAIDPPRPAVERLGPDLARVTAHEAGGIPGRIGIAHVVGRRRIVVVDPGDPSDAAAAAVLEAVDAHDGVIEAIVLTGAHPDHSGGGEALALRLGIPIVAPASAVRRLPHEVVVCEDLADIPFGDTPIPAVVLAPGGQRRSGSTSSTRMSNASRWTEGSSPGK